MRHPLPAGGHALRGGDFRRIRPLRAGAGGGLRLGAGRLLRPAGGLLRLSLLPGLRRGAAVRGRLHPGLLPGLCLLRREGLPQELVHAPGGGGDGRHHGLCVLI